MAVSFKITFIIFCAAILAMGADNQAPEDLELVYTMLVTRHGARAPTMKIADSEDVTITTDDWETVFL
jgi:hypothetical protein